MEAKIIEGNLVDVKHGLIYPVKIAYNKKVISITRVKKRYKQFIVPGLIDSHIHIESTMLTPQRFSEAVLPHGTVATVSDPHEIANVSGLKGIKFMIANTPEKIKINYTAPSCVPATDFETSGAKINAKEVGTILKMKRVVALGEMMNYPGVINKEKEVMEKNSCCKET